MSDRTDFRNFKPSHELESFTNSILSQLLSRAPYGASITSMLERIGEIYYCRVEIGSKSGTFKTRIVAKSPQSAIERARSQILVQLSRWRQTRFTVAPLAATPA
jgi:hypothetical protein